MPGAYSMPITSYKYNLDSRKQKGKQEFKIQEDTGIIVNR